MGISTASLAGKANSMIRFLPVLPIKHILLVIGSKLPLRS
ncbi:hypothetical protein OROMI_017586 [Orobanche minor]